MMDPFKLTTAAMLEPLEPFLSKLEAEALIAMCHAHASVRLAAVELLYHARALGQALTSGYARMTDLISGKAQDREREEERQKQYEDLLTQEDEVRESRRRLRRELQLTKMLTKSGAHSCSKAALDAAIQKQEENRRLRRSSLDNSRGRRNSLDMSRNSSRNASPTFSRMGGRSRSQEGAYRLRFSDAAETRRRRHSKAPGMRGRLLCEHRICAEVAGEPSRLAHERVEQRRLARVHGTDQRHPRPVNEVLTRSPRRRQPSRLRDHLSKRIQQLVVSHIGQFIRGVV